MNEGLVFPDTADVLISLLDGTVHDGAQVSVVTWLPSDSHGQLRGPFPLVHVTTLSGTQGYIDRAERAVLDVYAPGQQAKNTLTSIIAFIVGDQIDSPAGFVDEIGCVLTPSEIPYQSDTLSKATAQVEVVARPFN